MNYKYKWYFVTWIWIWGAYNFFSSSVQSISELISICDQSVSCSIFVYIHFFVQVQQGCQVPSKCCLPREFMLLFIYLEILFIFIYLVLSHKRCHVLSKGCRLVGNLWSVWPRSGRLSRRWAGREREDEDKGASCQMLLCWYYLNLGLVCQGVNSTLNILDSSIFVITKSDSKIADPISVPASIVTFSFFNRFFANSA